MSFYYNARWSNPVQYPMQVGGWRGGYGLGAFTPSDFDAAQLENAALAQKGVSAAMTVGNLGDVNVLGQQFKDALYNLPDYNTVANVDNATSIFQLDDDEKIYALYVAAHSINEMEKSDAADALIDGEVSKATGGQIADFDTLVDKLHQAYEDYFNAYYDEEAGQKQAQQGGGAVATTVSKTGKPRNPKIKRQQVHKPKWMTTVLITGGVLGAGGLLYWLMNKNKRRF